MSTAVVSAAAAGSVNYVLETFNQSNTLFKLTSNDRLDGLGLLDSGLISLNDSGGLLLDLLRLDLLLLLLLGR